MRAYQRDVRARDELGLQIGAYEKLGKPTRNMQFEWGRLQADIETSPVHKLVEDGLFTSISEDIGLGAGSLREKALTKATDKLKGIIPDAVVSGVKELYVLPGSKAYKVAMAVTQYSDFVARFTKYSWDTKEKGVDPDVAIRNALATLVYYDMPQNPTMQYLNDTGFLMFTKYFLRIQPIVARIYSQNPAYAFGVLALQQVMLPKPFSSNIAEYGMGSGITQKPTWNPVAKAWETMDLSEPSLLQIALNPFGL